MASSTDFHENLNRGGDVKGSSERSFGIVFAVVFLIIALFPLISGGEVRIWSVAVAALFSVAAFLAPGILGPLNRVWFLFGQLLHRIVSPLVMGLIFFGTVVPTGLLMRLLGKRPIPLEFDPEAATYWVERDPPGPEPSTMKNQF